MSEDFAINAPSYAFGFVVVLSGVGCLIYAYHLIFETATAGSLVYGSLLIALGLSLNYWAYKSLNRPDPETIGEAELEPFIKEVEAEIEQKVRTHV